MNNICTFIDKKLLIVPHYGVAHCFALYSLQPNNQCKQTCAN